MARSVPSEIEWSFRRATFWTDADGQEWLVLPMVGDVTAPELMRGVADVWDAENEREANA